jgi:hypothetical protein
MVVHTVIELHEDRVIKGIVALRLATNPQTVSNTGLRRELHLDVSARTRKCIAQLRRAGIWIVQ